MNNCKVAANGSHRRECTSGDNFSSNPNSEPQPIGVAADKRIADLLEALATTNERIANAIENQCRSVIQALPPKALSYERAAEHIGVDLPTIKELVRTRKLPYVQYGSQRGRMILVKDLHDFLMKNRVPSDDELASKKRCK